MGTEENSDREMIARLREKAERLEFLETRLEALEQERKDLINTKNQLSGKLANYHLSLQEWEWFFEHSVQMLCIAGCDSISFENRYRAKDGSWRWIAWYCPAISNVTTKLFAIARDITEDRRKEAEILYKASHDSLTGLHNRSAFEENLEDAIAQQRRNQKGEVLLYLIDIDGFKEVNDRHGHMAGDHLLQVIAKRFRDIQRAGEMVARVGGDEFAFVVSGSPETSVSHPHEPLAERIIAQVRKPVELNRGAVTVGCSIGVAVFPETASDFLSLISQADKAMYATKRSGKNGYRKFDPSLA